MSEERFQKTRIVDKWGGIYDSQTDRILDVNDNDTYRRMEMGKI